MGIRFFCPNGHKLNIKAHLAGKRGVCPVCGGKMRIPLVSTRPPGKKKKRKVEAGMVPPSEAGPTRRHCPDADEIEAWLEGEDEAGPSSPRASRTEDGSPSPLFEEMDLAALAAFGVPDLPPEKSESGPLDTTGEAIWYVRPPSGGQFGPASSPVVSSWVREGRVPADSLVWREGWRDWKTAVEAFPQLGLPRHPTPRHGLLSQPPLPPKPPLHRPLLPQRSGIPQSTILIVLLAVATVVVATVLVWMLIRRGETPPATEPAPSPARSWLPYAPAELGPVPGSFLL